MSKLTFCIKSAKNTCRIGASFISGCLILMVVVFISWFICIYCIDFILYVLIERQLTFWQGSLKVMNKRYSRAINIMLIQSWFLFMFSKL